MVDIEDFNPAKFAADMQLRTRKEKKFDEVEAELPEPSKPTVAAKRFSVGGALNSLSKLNPFARAAGKGDVVWLFDNTAYKHGHFSSWEAEFVAAVFEEEPKSRVVDMVSGVARVLGLADDAEERKTIQERLMPFIWDTEASKTVTAKQEGSHKELKLSPTGFNGISSTVLKVPSHSKGAFAKSSAKIPSGVPGLLGMQTYYAGQTGWGFISGRHLFAGP